MIGPLALAAALVLYNGLANRRRAFHGWAYVPMNLTLAVVVGLLGIRLFDLDREALGADGTSWWVGLAIGLGAMAPVCALLFFERGRRLLRDPRLAGEHGWRAAFVIGVRIPIGTAAVEEFVFRGVLLASMLERGNAIAITVSSAAFGLWHIVPTMDLSRANRLSAAVVPVGVVLTAASGAFLSWLRLETGSLAAPMLLHASINSLAAFAAILALRSCDPPRLNR